jgi:CRISPR/Cas system CSM-associated protein Csm5 (group 7 of RAMP superfamily)
MDGGYGLMQFADFPAHKMNTTLTMEKIKDYTIMLCDALYMNIKDQQIKSHQRAIQNNGYVDENYVSYHQQKIDEIKNRGVNVEFFYKEGKKYLKIIMIDAGGQRHVHAFVDKNNGDIYKPASWRAPAKYVRYCLMNDDHREWLYANADWAGGYLYL